MMMTRKPRMSALGFAIAWCCLLPGLGFGCEHSATERAVHNNPLIEQAIADLARRESVPQSAIELVSFEAVTWPDTSMGCPHPGMRYHQVPQDGARIVLQVKGEQRVYHSGGKRAPFLCTRY